jgi:hypothetical protein
MKMLDANSMTPLKPGEPGHDIADAVSVAVEVKTVKDWEGHKVPEPSPDDVVKIWSINAHRDPSYTDCVIMGWQDMLAELPLLIESKLENMDMDDLKEGLGVEVKLVEMRYGDYAECVSE